VRAFRLVGLGFACGAAVAFGVSLLRKRGIAQAIGYRAPDPAVGPAAVVLPADQAIDLTETESRSG